MRTLSLFLLLATCLHSGCALCPPGYLEDYATVGGKWQRSDATSGRVGSILSDPGSTQGTHAETLMVDTPYYGDGPVFSDEARSMGAFQGSATDPQQLKLPGIGESVPAPVPDPMSDLGDDF